MMLTALYNLILFTWLICLTADGIPPPDSGGLSGSGSVPGISVPGDIPLPVVGTECEPSGGQSAIGSTELRKNLNGRTDCGLPLPLDGDSNSDQEADDGSVPVSGLSELPNVNSSDDNTNSRPNNEVNNIIVNVNRVEEILSHLAGNESMNQTSILEIQNLYCPITTCGVRPDIHCNGLCDWCNCGDACSKYGSCCLGEIKIPPRTDWTCVSLERNHRKKTGKYMIGTCPPNYPNQEVRSNCEGNNFSTLYNLLPVYKELTPYKNRFCALCNGVTEFVNSEVEVTCAEVLPIPSSLAYLEAYDMVIQQWPCDVSVKSPNEAVRNSPPCMERDLNNIISECNRTGEWQHYNRYIEEVCHSYTHIFDGVYKNVFCYLCNTNNYDVPCRSEDDGVAGSGRQVSLSQLLDFNAHRTESAASTYDEITCDNGSHYDYLQKKCKEIFCHPGKWYNGSHCKVIASERGGSERYLSDIMLRSTDSVNFTFCVNKNTGHPDDLFNTMMEKTEHTLASMKNKLETFIKLRLQKHGFIDPFSYRIKIAEIVSHEYFDCSKNIENVTSQSIGMRTALKGFWTSLFLYGRHWLLLERVADLLDDFLSLMPVLTFQNANNITFSKDRDMTYSFRKKRFSMISVDTFETYQHVYDSFSSRQLNKLMFCPYIVLNISMCQILNDGKEIKILSQTNTLRKENSESSILVDFEDFEIIDESIVHVCSDTYFRLQMNQKPLFSSGIKSAEVEGILSVVLTSMSVVCLILTVIVYSVIPSLRSVPGLNNMALSITMLLAQLLFQFGASHTQFKMVCKVIGILIHYSWLSVLLWMNVCSFHMFKVFGFSKQSQLQSSKFKQFIKYAIYAFTTPILFIVGNVVASAELSDMTDIGYGGAICYINKRELIGLTFALPVGLVVISNILMFVIVVVSIGRQAADSSFAASDKDYLNIYFRLSTVTGATWIFGFIYQWTGQTVFSYLFIALNATQGVFIFVAFVMTRRVLKKLRALAIGDKGSRATSTRTRTSSTVFTDTSNE